MNQKHEIFIKVNSLGRSLQIGISSLCLETK
jgi:hypothetical protein